MDVGEDMSEKRRKEGSNARNGGRDKERWNEREKAKSRCNRKRV